MCPLSHGYLNIRHDEYAAIALVRVAKNTMQNTTHKVSKPRNKTVMSINMPTPIRKYGINNALPINSRRFINGDTLGIKRLRINPARKAPNIPSNPHICDTAALKNSTHIV